MDGGMLTHICPPPDPAGVPARAVPERHAARVCAGALRALAFLHRRHRVHRDVKSDNLLLSRDGRVKLADFGFAATMTRERSKRCSVVRARRSVPFRSREGRSGRRARRRLTG